MGCSPVMCGCFVRWVLLRCVYPFFLSEALRDDTFTRPANPSYTVDELSKSRFGLSHPFGPSQIATTIPSNTLDDTTLTRPTRSLPDPSLRREIAPDLPRLPPNRARRRSEDGHPAHANRRVRHPRPHRIGIGIGTARSDDEGGAGALRHRWGIDSGRVGGSTRV